jgi:hypothetical protein
MFANLEALINIFANCSEIIAFIGGLPLILTCFFPAAFGLRGYSLKLLMMGVYAVIVGFNSPHLLNEALQCYCPERIVTSTLLAIFALSLTIFLSSVAIYVGALCLPSIIAFRENRPRKRAIMICNIFSIVPPAWLLAYLWACLPSDAVQ